MARHGYCVECGVLKPVRPVEVGVGPKELCFSCRKEKKQPAVDAPQETVEFLEAVRERPLVEQMLREKMNRTNIG